MRQIVSLAERGRDFIDRGLRQQKPPCLAIGQCDHKLLKNLFLYEKTCEIFEGRRLSKSPGLAMTVQNLSKVLQCEHPLARVSEVTENPRANVLQDLIAAQSRHKNLTNIDDAIVYILLHRQV